MSRSAAVLLATTALFASSTGAVTEAASVTTSADHQRAPSWGQVVKLAPNPWGADLAVDGRGRVIAAWSTGSWPHTIWVSVRSAAGTWGTPTKLGLGGTPAIAADTRGDLAVVWRSERRGFTDGVRAVTRAWGGRWSPPVQLAPGRRAPGYVTGVDGYLGAAEIGVAMNAGGFTVATWAWGSDYLDKPYRIRAATRSRAGAWSDQQVITPANGANGPQAVVSPGPNAMIAFDLRTGGATQTRVRRLAHGSWTPSEPAVMAGGVGAGVDRHGIVTLAYAASDDTMAVVTAPPDGPWSTPTAVATGAKPIESFTLDVNARGAAVVTVLRDNGAIAVVRRTADGTWLAPVTIAGPSTDAAFLVAGTNGVGDAFVGWGGDAVHGKYRPAAGSWSDPMLISPRTGAEVLEQLWAEVLPNGDVAVLWDQEERPLKVRVMDAS